MEGVELRGCCLGWAAAKWSSSLLCVWGQCKTRFSGDLYSGSSSLLGDSLHPVLEHWVGSDKG